jgi:hypothetical protein
VRSRICRCTSVGWPEDQARVALFPASDRSAFVTGHNVAADGGTKAGGGGMWYPCNPVLVGTKGGLRTNVDARVLDADDRPIPGALRGREHDGRGVR